MLDKEIVIIFLMRKYSISMDQACEYLDDLIESLYEEKRVTEFRMES
jgi:hypothetical protein